MSAPRVEYHKTPFGIGEDRPRLSWSVDGDLRDWVQSAYEIESVDPQGVAERSGPVEGDAQVYVAWPFVPLRSRDRRSVRVRVWGPDGAPSDWSAPTALEVGLLEQSDWVARTVRTPWRDAGKIDQPCPFFRREFVVREGLVAARLYLTAQGVVEASVNGVTVGDEVMAPGWTSYSNRLAYRAFDVTTMLTAGANAIGAMLGDGWFRGRLAWGKGRREVYGAELGLVAQLELQYADGGREVVATDERWRCATGPLRSSSLYDGEVYDARLAVAGWDRPGFDDGAWTPVDVADLPEAALVAPLREPVRVVEEIAPAAVFRSPSGALLVDFGQIVTGRLRIRVSGAPGTVVVIRHAEVLENGELGVRPLRTAKATDTYVCAGGEPEWWEPRFTMHGFRYAEISGWVPGPGDVVARVCQADIDRIGWFTSSNAQLNRLHENLVWSLRGNFTHLPSDCAQRDERLGWTGDAQVISPSASFLFDAAPFYGYWLQDLALDQRPDGTVPMVIPAVPLDPFPGSYPVSGWGDSAAVIPVVVHRHFADLGIVERQFESAAAWARAEARAVLEPGSFPDGFQFGDWLDPSAPPEHPEDGRTDPAIVMSLYAIRSASLVASSASLLGRADDEAEFQELADRLRRDFAHRFASPAGFVVSDSQTALALAIAFEALPGLEGATAARLVDVIARNRGRLGVGFLGGAVILDVLAEHGALDLAYSLLLSPDVASWLYPVTMGATTIWERWDSLLPDGSINPGDMTSFSHYALGAVVDWLHRTVAGMAPAEPGYRTIAVRPRPGGGLDHASAKHVTPYGMAEVGWRIDGQRFELHVVVPPGARAIVHLPDGSAPLVAGSGVHDYSIAWPALDVEEITA